MNKNNQKPKIVRIFSRLNIGGPSLQVTLLSEALSPHYDTVLVTGAVEKIEGDMSYLIQKPTHFRHHFISELGRNVQFGKDIIAFWKIFCLLKREKPLVVHTHTSKAGVLGRIAAFLAGVPVIVHTFHGHVFEGYYGRIKSCVIIFLERSLAFFSSKIIAISLKQRDDLVMRFRVAGFHKVSVIPLGFNLAPFYENNTDTTSARKNLGLPLHSYCIGIVGRLVPIKNHHFFLKICKEISVIRKDVHFVIVGDGECYSSLIQQVKYFNLEERISFLGWQKNMPLVYRAFDIVMLTSLNEGTPVSLIEAQASACPVIASRVGGTEDVVSSGKTGYVLPVHEKKAFVEAIAELLENDDKRRRMGDEGRELMKKKFDQINLVSNVSHLYSDLLKEKYL